jgi:exosome complex component RRP42
MIFDDLRADGRSCEDYRHMEVETDVVSNAAGSARLRLANTDVLVGVKVEIGEPLADQPDEGCIRFFVDCSANATPEFEGRGGEELATSITSMLARAYSHCSCLDLTSLCIIPKLKCWILYVDILLLECGGNLFDVVSLAVKAALYNTRIPVLKVSINEDETPEIEVSDDPYDCKRLDISGAPCLVTLSKVGSMHVVDASVEEETCALARLMIGITESGEITGLRKESGGSLDPESIFEMMESGRRVGMTLNKSLMTALVEEEKETKTREQTGFLRL